MDMNLPLMDGWEATRRIKSAPETRGVPVIAVTAHGMAGDREKVLEAGGLYIVGTERHESRRIDNQLRGRSGRQGDPGESRFFLSAEDDLVRLFAGDRIYRILDRLGPTTEEGEEEPIEAKMLSKQIENAQRKVEEQNYLIRKRVLEYDDVMNQQREIVYQYRDEVLEGRDMGPVAREAIGDVIGRLGGEEFALLLPETSLAAAQMLARRITDVCRTLEVPTRGTMVRFTCSIGVTEVSNGDDSLEAVLRRADAALYSAKHSGRDRVVAAV